MESITGGKGMLCQYRLYMKSIQDRRDGIMESIQEGRGYEVNTGGKGFMETREGVMESIQEGRDL